MSWIICSNNEILYEIEESNNHDWFNKGPWYTTSICSKQHGKVFVDFIKNVRTDRYNLICSMIAHDKQKPTYVDDDISSGDITINRN